MVTIIVVIAATKTNAAMTAPTMTPTLVAVLVFDPVWVSVISEVVPAPIIHQQNRYINLGLVYNTYHRARMEYGKIFHKNQSYNNNLHAIMPVQHNDK